MRVFMVPPVRAQSTPASAPSSMRQLTREQCGSPVSCSVRAVLELGRRLAERRRTEHRLPAVAESVRELDADGLRQAGEDRHVEMRALALRLDARLAVDAFLQLELERAASR